MTKWDLESTDRQQTNLDFNLDAVEWTERVFSTSKDVISWSISFGICPVFAYLFLCPSVHMLRVLKHCAIRHLQHPSFSRSSSHLFDCDQFIVLQLLDSFFASFCRFSYCSTALTIQTRTALDHNQRQTFLEPKLEGDFLSLCV